MCIGIEAKLESLAIIANILNENKVTWAVGGSFLLYAKSISDSFDDIDIIVAEDHVDALKILLKDYCLADLSEASAQYKSKAYLKCKVDGTKFDFIAGFTIICNGTENYFPFTQDNIEDFLSLGGASIPLHALIEWKMYYYLMGRCEKAALIERYLTDVGWPCFAKEE